MLNGVPATMSLSSKPEFDKLTLPLGPLINWQKFGTFLPGIKHEHIQSPWSSYPCGFEIHNKFIDSW